MRQNKNDFVVIWFNTRMHSSRMRTARCSSHLLEGCLPRQGGVCPGRECLPVGVCRTSPPRGQNDRCLWKHYLATTTLRTVINIRLIGRPWRMVLVLGQQCSFWFEILAWLVLCYCMWKLVRSYSYHRELTYHSASLPKCGLFLHLPKLGECIVRGLDTQLAK